MKHIGLIIFILGALSIVIPAFANFESKVTLVVGLSLLLIGMVVHCFVTKKAIDNQK